MFYNKQMTSIYTTADLLQKLMKSKQRQEKEKENKNISLEDLKREIDNTAYYSIINREDEEEKEEKELVIRNNKENKIQRIIFYIKITICVLSILLCVLCITYVIRQRRIKEFESGQDNNEQESITCETLPQEERPIIRTIYIKPPNITYEKQEINKVVEVPEIIHKQSETINKQVIENEKIETKPQIEENKKDDIINKEDLIKLKELNKNISNMSTTTNNNINTLKEISEKYGEINNKIKEIEGLYNKVVIIKPNEEKKEEKENETKDENQA